MKVIDQEKENMFPAKVGVGRRRNGGLKEISGFDGLFSPNDFASAIAEPEIDDLYSLEDDSTCCKRNHTNTLFDSSQHWRNPSNGTTVSSDIYTDCCHISQRNSHKGNMYTLENSPIDINTQSWEDAFNYVSDKQKWSQRRQNEYRNVFKQISLSKSQIISLYGHKRVHRHFQFKKSMRAIYSYWFPFERS